MPVEDYLMTELLSGLLGAIMGSASTILFQRWSDKKTRLDSSRFQIYMMLLELNGWHWWIASTEVRGVEVSKEIVRKFDRARWRIADELRKADDLPECSEILAALFSLEFKSESDRAASLKTTIDKLGTTANPRYTTAIKEVSLKNQELMRSDINEFCRRQNKLQLPL